MPGLNPDPRYPVHWSRLRLRGRGARHPRGEPVTQRVVLAALPAYGHVGPIRTIGAALVQDGYDVTVVTGALFRKSLVRAGGRFVALTGIADWDPRRVQARYPESTRIPA